MHLAYSVGSLLHYNDFSTEKRIVIKYLKCLSAAEIWGELNSVLGDNAPSDATIYRRIAEFQRRRKST